MKKLFFACIFSLGLAGGIQAQTPADEYTQAVEKLLVVSNAKGQFEKLIPQLFNMLRSQSPPNVPAELWDKGEKKFLEQAGDEILRIYVPIYREYLTLEDVQDIISFYESPAGRKLAAATPDISLKGGAAGQEWGLRIVQEIIAELEEGGYNLE